MIHLLSNHDVSQNSAQWQWWLQTRCWSGECPNIFLSSPLTNASWRLHKCVPGGGSELLSKRPHSPGGSCSKNINVLKGKKGLKIDSVQADSGLGSSHSDKRWDFFMMMGIFLMLMMMMRGWRRNWMMMVMMMVINMTVLIMLMMLLSIEVMRMIIMVFFNLIFALTFSIIYVVNSKNVSQGTLWKVAHFDKRLMNNSLSEQILLGTLKTTAQQFN